jgi:tyrosine-protein kinase Etk/Wzc
VGLAGTLAESQEKLAAAETRFNAPAPEVQGLRAQVDAQLQGIRNYVKARLTRARESLHTLDGIVTQYQDKLKTVPSAEVGLAQLTRETEVYSAMYSQLLRQQQETGLIKASAISKNRILDPPEVPYREEMLRLGIGLASGPVGLLLGALFVVLRSVTSGRFQHIADVLRHLGSPPVLATVPHVVRRDERLPLECTEAFRTLRTNLYQACGREGGSVVLFTSPCSGDGKTMCAYLLTNSLARDGRTVLLVDTGLRRDPPGDSDDGAGEGGLGDVLRDRQEWRDVAREVRLTDGCVFHMIQGGGEDSTDLLASPAMLDFLDEVRGAYDFVLLEAPSYPAVSDTLVLSTLADYVVDVIRIEHTSRALATDNVRQLSASTSNYGLLLNDVSS